MSGRRRSSPRSPSSRCIVSEPDEIYADTQLAKVGQLAVSREIISVKARLQRMNPVDEQAGYNRMFGDLVGLEKRRKALLSGPRGPETSPTAALMYPPGNKIGSPVIMGWWRRLLP